jgi:hypothetical protein
VLKEFEQCSNTKVASIKHARLHNKNLLRRTPPRARQQSSDVPRARTHGTVGEKVVSLVLCTSSTNTQTRSLTWCVHRISHQDVNPDRIFRSSFIARSHPSRGITHRAVSSFEPFSYRAASSPRGILHRAASSSSCGIIRRTVSSSRGIIHHAASSSRGIIMARYHPSTNSKVLYIGTTRWSRIQSHAHGNSLVILFKLNPNILPCASVLPDSIISSSDDENETLHVSSMLMFITPPPRHLAMIGLIFLLLGPIKSPIRLIGTVIVRTLGADFDRAIFDSGCASNISFKSMQSPDLSLHKSCAHD